MSEFRFEPSGYGVETAHSDITVAGSIVPFTIERPDRRRFADEISENAVLYLTGWTESEDSLKPLRRATAKLGTAAVTFNHPRYKRPDKVFRAEHLRIENVAAVTEMLQQDYSSVSFGAHSMAGIDGTSAIIEKELDIRVLALLGSAALIYGDSARQVSPRLFEELVYEEAPMLLRNPWSEWRALFASAKTFAESPVLGFYEGIETGNHYVGRHIPEIINRGTIVANIMADGDRIFPVEKVLQSTQDLPIDIVRVFNESCHNFTNHRPNEVGAFIIDIIEHADELRSLRTKKKVSKPHKISQPSLKLATA